MLAILISALLQLGFIASEGDFQPNNYNSVEQTYEGKSIIIIDDDML